MLDSYLLLLAAIEGIFEKLRRQLKFNRVCWDLRRE